MASTIKFLLGLVPSTEALESKRNALLAEFNELQEFIKSDKLAGFKQLTTYVESKEFAEKKQYYQSLVFKGSDEQKKEEAYLNQKKSADIKFYYKYKNTPLYQLYIKMEGSKAIQDYEHLKSFIESPQFKKVEEYMKDKKKFEKTQEFQKYQEYIALKENQSFKNYFKFIHDKAYSDFSKLYKSSKIADFEQLEKYIQSGEFINQKNTMKKADFMKSDAHKKNEEYLKLKKSTEIKNYYKLANSPLLADYKKLNNSEELKFFNELEAFIKSPAYINKKKEIESLRFENTDEYKKLQEYKTQSNTWDIKGYYKARASKELSEFQRIEKSKIIPAFEELEKYIQSDEFKTRKGYLLDFKKWEKTEEYKKFAELEALKKDPKIIWYLKIKDSNKFDELKAWNMVFEDDFTENKTDRNKWLTRYFWGEVLLNDTYALPGEKHLFHGEKNLQQTGSALKIITRKEKVQGKEWNPAIGFFSREFDYTSGIINSGSSFRAKYGKIEAKIRITPSKGVMHAFWLAGDTIVPQIDIFKCVDNKIQFGSFWGPAQDTMNVQKDITSVSAGIVKNKYMIYSLEWSPEGIIWKINQQVIKTQTTNIPGSEMYISLNSGVLDDQADVNNCGLEIDWVRCYQKN